MTLSGLHVALVILFIYGLNTSTGMVVCLQLNRSGGGP